MGATPLAGAMALLPRNKAVLVGKTRGGGRIGVLGGEHGACAPHALGLWVSSGGGAMAPPTWAHMGRGDGAQRDPLAP
jgi:hypothetical protein